MANITIAGALACGDPTGLASSSITNTSATVGWTAVASALSYDVDYKLTSSSTWTNAATATTSTSVNIAGLTQGTVYNWRVRATCSGGSGNYIAAQFTTTAPCTAPSGLASSTITSSSATVSWTAVSGATSYAVDYKLNSSSTWISATASTTSTSVSLGGLTASSLYDWRVNTTCSSGTTVFATAQFTTTAVSTCPGTYDVSTNGTRAGAAVIPFNTNINGLISPSGDNDYYGFTITTGGTITVTLGTLPADYDLKLYNGSSVVATSANSGTASETINYTAAAGTYYAKVYGFKSANNATVCYTLKVQLGTATKSSDESAAVVSFVSDNLSVAPNPVSSLANLSFKSDAARTATVTITNQLGNTVLSKKLLVTEGMNKNILDVSNLANGMYYIKLQNGSTVQMARIIVQK